MARLRHSAAVACLLTLLMAALPTAASAHRSAGQSSGYVQNEPAGAHLLGDVLAWGRNAFAWLQALIAAEHGGIVPLATPPPPPPPPFDPDI